MSPTWVRRVLLTLIVAVAIPVDAQPLKPAARSLPLSPRGLQRLKQRVFGQTVRQVVQLPKGTVMRKDRYTFDAKTSRLQRRSTEVQIDKPDGTVIISQRRYLPKGQRMHLGKDLRRNPSRLWLSLKAMLRTDSSHVVTLPAKGGRVERLRLRFEDQTVGIHKTVRPDGTEKARYKESGQAR